MGNFTGTLIRHKTGVEQVSDTNVQFMNDIIR